jgi:hypothetical protein
MDCLAFQHRIVPWRGACRSSLSKDQSKATGLYAGFEFRYIESGIANPLGVLCRRCELSGSRNCRRG